MKLSKRKGSFMKVSVKLVSLIIPVGNSYVCGKSFFASSCAKIRSGSILLMEV